MNTFYPSHRSPLQPLAFVPLPLGAVKPLGWLLDQCLVQANGLSGHLEEFWPDLGPDNMWLGGGAEGWERGPYYLDGLIPLARVLDDDRLIAMAQRWVDSILGMCGEDGWIGPVQAPGQKAYDQWPVAVVLKALAQHYEATSDDRVFPAMTGFCRYLLNTLHDRPLFSWGAFRWADLALSVQWLYVRTGEDFLPDVLRLLHEQGYDWRKHFTEFPYESKTARENCTLDSHVVNSAMAIKAGAVTFAQTGDPGDRESVAATLSALDRFHGQVTGVFSGDEHYAGKDPSQGTELCAVVEAMFSLETLLAYMGDTSFADRLEKIAYNALPATFTPEMWAHQYDQQVNQVLCTVAPRAWTNNGDMSNIYGLEPNYGCCTANFHQGWPKLVKSMWMATPDDGLAAVALGPCAVTARVARGREVTVCEETDYPFRGEVRFTIHSGGPVIFPLTIRIPDWAEGATVWLEGCSASGAEAGTWHRIEREWRDGDCVVLHLPLQLRAERRYNGSVSVLRGPLVFALKIGEDFRHLRGEAPHADWEVYPTTPWNYGLILRDGLPILSGQQESPVGRVPFRPDSAPVTLMLKARRVPQWTMEMNSAGQIPAGPVASHEPVEDIALIPFGSTNLRIGEFPALDA